MLQIKTFTFNPIEENTYLLVDEAKNCIIVDPGCYFDHEKDELKNFITRNHLNPVYLLNTHCHLDHVFGNLFVAEEYKLKLHAHRLEKEVLDMAPVSGLMYNLPFDNYTDEIVYIREGETITTGQNTLRLIHVPGHSPGSLCFYCEEQKFLIGGDVLFRESIGRTDLPLGNHQALLSGIREKLFTLPDDVVVYPGHGPATTIGHEKVHNAFLS